MKLSAITVPIYGDTSFRGKCPDEGLEQITVFNWLRTTYPNTYGLLALHPRNEGLVAKGQHSAVSRHRAEGMTKGAADIIIPGNPSFVCELKRQDHTQSTLSDEQHDYLATAQGLGCFACVALGHQGALEAFKAWLAGSPFSHTHQCSR
jgi:hypothetical protein